MIPMTDTQRDNITRSVSIICLCVRAWAQVHFTGTHRESCPRCLPSYCRETDPSCWEFPRGLAARRDQRPTGRLGGAPPGLRDADFADLCTSERNGTRLSLCQWKWWFYYLFHCICTLWRLISSSLFIFLIVKTVVILIKRSNLGQLNVNVFIILFFTYNGNLLKKYYFFCHYMYKP